MINRPLLFTASSFIGIQQYSGQFIKNVDFSWKGLSNLLQKIIYFNLFGNPNVLCDINLNYNLFNTNQELFIRFMQIISLNIHFIYPNIFNEILNNNNENEKKFIIDNNYYNILKNILKIRNSLYLYIYTYHLKNHYEGGGFFLPLSSYIAANKEIFKINDQFMLGANILVSPVLKANERIKPTYFGLIKSENYYDFYTYEKIDFNSNEYIEIKAPLNKIPMFLRGGFITPILDINDNEFNINSNEIKNKNVNLIIALDYDYNSEGKIILDNNSDEYYRMELVSLYDKEKNNIVIIFRVIHRSYVPNNENDFKKFGKITILGLNKRPNRIMYNIKNNEIDVINEIEYNKIVFNEKNILYVNLENINLLLNTENDYKIILEDI
jgi:alpha-glucosidase